MRVFDGDAHLLEHVHGRATEVHPWAAGHMIEVSALVDGRRNLGPVVLAFEEIELDFGVDVEGEALVFGLRKRPLQHMARIAEACVTLRSQDVAEHACCPLRSTTPREDLEGGGIRFDDHIVLGDPGHAFDRRTVEAQSLFEGRFELGWRDGNGFQSPQHIGEP